MTSFDQQSLASAAGIDPWALLKKLQSGDPAQIEALAAAFYKAGGHLADASQATEQSHAYVKAGYKVQGAAPLDFNASAAQTKASIAGGAEHLPAIAKILTSVATDLDGATKKAAAEVNTLDGVIQKYENEWIKFFQTTGHHLPEEDWEPVRQGYVNDAVSAVKSHGAAVNGYLTGYESTLGKSLKSMADLGYIPPDAVDEGPGDVDLNLARADKDAQTTIDAANSKDKSAGLKLYDQGTAALDLINRAVKANGGHVSDADYSYLWEYYNKTTPHATALNTLLSGTGADRAHRAPVWADGLLNLSAGAEQKDDAGHDPHAYGRPAPHMPDEPIGRGGLSGLPQSVQDILSSDIGKVQSSPQYPGADDKPMLRRAEWEDGHWVVDNYATDSAFASLLGTAHNDVAGGNEFSQAYAEAGIRWKHDINAVETNTQNWLDAAHIYYNYPGVHSTDSDAVALGFPPDTDPKHLHLNLGDTAASDALTTAAHNSYASAAVLNDDGDRHAILGLNWQHGEGAGNIIAAGTAPDPHNQQIDPVTGNSIRNEAALKVMQDTGSDYHNFVKTASDPVKDALTNLAITHLDTFATVPESGGVSTVGTLVLPNGQHISGVSLNNDDAANFLKMIATTGPDRYGALHAAALQQGALWIHEAPGHGVNSGANYASILDGRVSTAGLAAAHDLALQSNASNKDEFAAQLAEQQDESTQKMLGKIAFQTVGAGLDIVSFGASDHVKDALEQVGALRGILSDGYDDYNDYNENDPNSEYIQKLQEQMQTALSAPHDQAHVTYAVSQDQAWMALKAAGLDPSHNPALNQALDSHGNPVLPPGVLQGPGGATSSSVDTSTPQYVYITGEAGKRELINPLLEHTYGGSGNQDAWGAQGINATLDGDATDSRVKWTDGPIVAQTTTGDNKIVYWLPNRDPNTWEFEDAHDATPH
jgi:hydrolase family protein